MQVYGHTFTPGGCKKCGMVHALPEPGPKPTALVQKAAQERRRTRIAEVTIANRLRKIAECPKCHMLCSVCQSHRKCCFDQKQPAATPPIADRKRFPEEQGYAIDQGPDEGAWDD